MNTAARINESGVGTRNSVSRNTPYPLRTLHSAPRTSQAFTMIEIAISLAVIGFALVAILGVLPVGLNVQKENREETIINQDASVFMNAIRNGAQGMDDLANYVMAITNYVTPCDRNGRQKGVKSVNWYTTTNSSVSPAFLLNSGFRIVGLLSTPKYILVGNGNFVSNYVVASIRSLSGPVSDKFPQDNALVQDLAFSYRMIPEVVTFGTSYDNYNKSWGNAMSTNLQYNLHEVRLTFRWPLAKGTNAPGRQVYRTLVGGSLQETNEPGFPPAPNPLQPSGYDLYFLQPQTYVKTP